MKKSARPHLPSNNAKRSILIKGHRTSITLEHEFWDALKDIAEAQKKPLGEILSQIDTLQTGNLSSAVRVFVLRHYKGRRS